MLNQIKLDKGSVFWKESEIKRGDYLYKRDIGYVPDHDDMLEKLTAKEIIEFAAFAYQVPEAVFQERMNHLLDVFQLEHTAAPVQTFSRGMRKKVQMVSALISYPELLILDEPIAGLDPPMIYQLKRIIKSYTKEHKSVLVSTHDLSFAQEICDYMLVVHSGEMVATDKKEDVLKNYASFEQYFMEQIGDESKGLFVHDYT